MFSKLILLFGCICVSSAFFSCNSNTHSNSFINKDSSIKYEPVKLSLAEKQILGKSLKELGERYDPNEKMITKKLTGYNYHTDAQTGVFHEVRSSFSYAVGLLDFGGEENIKRGFDIIEKVISLQDTNSLSKTCGIWPYYQEEPLSTKKSPPDFNWADFNSVSLLDAVMGHEAVVPDKLKPIIKKSLILAARSIEKRNVRPGYTNIAIMGTYVTFMTSHLFDIPDMQEYAKSRLDNFYNYTIERGGFTEYNSPTYTIVALDELERMKRHIIAPDATRMIDSLYNIGWGMVARHYHKPSGQWTGPHSRSYRTLVNTSFYGILKQASNGEIDLGYENQRSDVKIKHHMPLYLFHYFLSPEYPRIETDVFAFEEPKILGTSYLTNTYALATANRSSLWNQRRPMTAYWGNIQKPHYLQVRFLHDFYDFSSANFYSQQKKNSILAAINFITKGGDKHISIDRLKDGKFKAKDLRLRFELGNYANLKNLTIPKVNSKSFGFTLDSIRFNLQLYQAVFGKYKGYWKTGGDEKNSWIDYVVYTGEEIEFDLNNINEAILGFTFTMGKLDEKTPTENPKVSVKSSIMNAKWKGMELEVPVKPILQPKNL